MSAWSRSEKIAAWSLLTALISCGTGLYALPPLRSWLAGLWKPSSPVLQPPPTPSPVFNPPKPDFWKEYLERRKREEEQQRLSREESRLVHEQIVELRLKVIASQERQLQAKGHRFSFRIFLKNSCHELLSVALLYLDLDGAWVSQGWWKVEPGKVIMPDVLTQNSRLFIYAKSYNFKWSGGNQARDLEWPVAPGRFYLIKDIDSYTYPSQEVVTFRSVSLGESFGDYTHAFSCNSKAR